ncbi:hypothetical protein AAFF_G00127100 [Aldrovandia affinis]|uniref:Uncharacterized protein n=1 Tax=Aldrovandia affinis TaxID=143900 RepID=A0AAD7T0W4_9TELE|nr:hypothetical protein AAFF_G00127100 [Aldrovandia affinis]
MRAEPARRFGTAVLETLSEPPAALRRCPSSARSLSNWREDAPVTETLLCLREAAPLDTLKKQDEKQKGPVTKLLPASAAQSSSAAGEAAGSVKGSSGTDHETGQHSQIQIREQMGEKYEKEQTFSRVL